MASILRLPSRTRALWEKDFYPAPMHAFPSSLALSLLTKIANIARITNLVKEELLITKGKERRPLKGREFSENRKSNKDFEYMLT